MLLKNAKILTMANNTLEKGDILIKNGKIVDIAKHIDGEGIDCSGCTITPGLIDAHCHIGMWEDGMDFEGADGNESSEPITPELRAIDGINPFDRCFTEAMQAGVTTAVTGPGSANVLGGQFCALKTKPGSVEDKLLKAPQSLKAAFGENPKTVYNEQKKSPMTRMAVAAMLRQSFIDAQEYGRDKEKAEKDPEKDFSRELSKDILLDVLSGTVQLKAHAHRADDILTALRITKEFGIQNNLSIEHGTEAYLIPQYLKDTGVKLVIGPVVCERSKIELKHLNIEAAKVLYDNGIEFAIMTDHPVIPIQYLLLSAALCAKAGLPDEEALKAITIYAAKACNIQDRVGSLEVSKDADIVVFSGDPLDIRSKVLLTVIDGEIVYDNRT